MTTPPALRLGAFRSLDGQGGAAALAMPAHHLVTYGVVVGMTGSGKTGLVTVEEALRAGVPVLAIDVKGDLPNLLLAFPSFAPELVAPWAAAMAAFGRLLPRGPRRRDRRRAPARSRGLGHRRARAPRLPRHDARAPHHARRHVW